MVGEVDMVLRCALLAGEFLWNTATLRMVRVAGWLGTLIAAAYVVEFYVSKHVVYSVGVRRNVKKTLDSLQMSSTTDI